MLKNKDKNVDNLKKKRKKKLFTVELQNIQIPHFFVTRQKPVCLCLVSKYAFTSACMPPPHRYCVI